MKHHRKVAAKFLRRGPVAAFGPDRLHRAIEVADPGSEIWKFIQAVTL